MSEVYMLPIQMLYTIDKDNMSFGMQLLQFVHCMTKIAIKMFCQKMIENLHSWPIKHSQAENDFFLSFFYHSQSQTVVIISNLLSWESKILRQAFFNCLVEFGTHYWSFKALKKVDVEISLIRKTKNKKQ